MPFKSEKQREWMHINHPEIADRWEREAKTKKEAAVQQSEKEEKKDE